MVLNLPGSTLFNPKGRAAHLLQRLEAELPTDVYAAAVERGKARDLDATVRELLAEGD
jgi:hypothetical protein